MGKGKIVEFVNEGVIFTFPAKLVDVYVEKLEKPDPWPGSDVFKEEGFVINFRFFTVDNPNLTEFKGTIEMLVRFTAAHEESAGGMDKLKLGFTEDTKWDLFKEDETKHGFKKIKEKKGEWEGYGKVKIKDKWVDPAMGWGP